MEKDMYNHLSHLAIIMDGNGRWAEQRSLPRYSGHKSGAKNLELILDYIKKNKICNHVTVFAFSTENLSRPKKEIDYIFNLIDYYIKKKINKIQDEEININFFGNLDKLSNTNKENIDNVHEKNCKNNNKSINIAINYGCEFDILQAYQSLIDKLTIDIKNDINTSSKEEIINKINDFKKNIKFSHIREQLLQKNIPNPDLLIRTGGHFRLSNFLLLQLAYTELSFTKTLWPSFSIEDLNKAIENFQKTVRKFGSI